PAHAERGSRSDSRQTTARRADERLIPTGRRMSDALRPSQAQALEAWAARVRANREQVDQFREANPSDFYAPVAGMFRADPRRRDEPTLEALRSILQPGDTLLDIGAGGGRYALPLADRKSVG